MPGSSAPGGSSLVSNNRDGVLIAVLEAGQECYLSDQEKAAEWLARRALGRRSVSPPQSRLAPDTEISCKAMPIPALCGVVSFISSLDLPHRVCRGSAASRRRVLILDPVCRGENKIGRNLHRIVASPSPARGWLRQTAACRQNN